MTDFSYANLLCSRKVNFLTVGKTLAGLCEVGYEPLESIALPLQDKKSSQMTGISETSFCRGEGGTLTFTCALRDQVMICGMKEHSVNKPSFLNEESAIHKQRNSIL